MNLNVTGGTVVARARKHCVKSVSRLKAEPNVSVSRPQDAAASLALVVAPPGRREAKASGRAGM